MSSRSFEHPLHRQPAVAAVMQLIDTIPDASHGRGGVQATLVQVRALMRLEAWATDRFDLSGAPGYAQRLADQLREYLPELDRYVALPEPLAAVHRIDEHDAELTEAARLANTEGPSQAQAFVAQSARPSLAARRVAAEGCWPSVKPAFVGRLDGDLGPGAYPPSILLAEALAEKGRWIDAHRVASQLPPRRALVARKAIVRQQAVAGLGPGVLSADLLDEYLWASARIAADRDNVAAAQELVDEMQDRRRRAVAHHEVLARAGQLASCSAVLVQTEGSMGPGDAQLMRAELAAAAGRPVAAWAHLVAAATGPRRDTQYWVEGVRPDLKIAQQLLYVMLKLGHCEAWPWGRRRQIELLDRLDAVYPVVLRLAHRQVRERLDDGVVRPAWLKARLRQAMYIRSLERIDLTTFSRQLHLAPEADAFIRGLMGDLAFSDALSRDPSDPVRAMYDDGLARSPRAARRRTGLLQAARRALQAGLRGVPTAVEAAEIRLTTMAHLGGDRVRRTLRHHLDQTAVEHRLHGAMTRAMIRVDGRGWLAKLFAEPERYGNRFGATDLHQALENATLTPRGFAQAVRALHEAVGGSIQGDPDPWWYALCALWWSRHTSPPTDGIVRWMAIQPPDTLRQGPRRTLAHFDDRRATLGRIDQTGMLADLDRDPSALANLLLTNPLPRGYGPVWSIKHWQRLVDRLAGRAQPIGWPDERMVAAWAQDRPLDVGASLWSGRPPLPELDRPLSVDGTPYKLFYLDKCRDAVRFWRFADTVPCCFNSRYGFYRRGDTQKQVLQLWRDPLSFCFEVRIRDEVAGFVFGGFGRTEGLDVLLLNGIYLRRSSCARTRAAIIDTIARVLVEPLGLKGIGVANVNRGYGRLPPSFQRKRRMLWRFRALVGVDGKRETSAFDDISNHVNQWGLVDLYWRK